MNEFSHNRDLDFLIQRLQKDAKPQRVRGTHGSSRAWILSKWIQSLVGEVVQNRTLVVITESNESASKWLEEAESMCVIQGLSAIGFHDFPGWDGSPYLGICPSLQNRHSRIGTLQQIQTAGIHVVFTTLEGLRLPTLPKDLWAALSFTLVTGSSVPRSTWTQKLWSLGYLRTDSVEDPGTFSIRGDLLDIFIPGSDEPYRLEFFGDELEKIRSFDPSTQRSSKDEHASVEVIPCREVLFQSSETRLKDAIKSLSDHRSIHRSIRDPVIQSIQERHYLDYSECWTTLAYEHPSTLFDYLGPSSFVIWDNEFQCDQTYRASVERYQNQFLEDQNNSRSRWILPSPTESFINQPITNIKLYFDQLDLSTTVETDSNVDFFQFNIETTGRFQQEIKDDFSTALSKLVEISKDGARVLLMAVSKSQRDRIHFLIQQRFEKDLPRFELIEGPLSSGFIWKDEKIAIFTENDFFGQKLKNRRRAKKDRQSAAKEWSGIQNLDSLQPGDAVVHVLHGIGRYLGMVRMGMADSITDFLHLEYSAKDKLYIPIYRINCVQKYLGSGQDVVLDKLGGLNFDKAKQKVRDAVKVLAIDLVKLYAERSIKKGPKFSGRDSVFAEFEEHFPFEETADQAQAIDDVLGDLQSGRLMDRLVCGDVGYGKTEVAIRAAFKVISEGKQVAVLVPTTVLAQQHEQSFINRFRNYPFRVESLSRFKSPKNQKGIILGISEGKVDVVIGTHRLLSKDIHFKDLGLVVVDEEHRFGVEHKEKLKVLKSSAHVLTLTATPIPRTLHMALSGLREMSLIATAPASRLPIKTFVAHNEDTLIQQAIQNELSRGGQVFFVYNRVQSIYETAEKIQRLVPGARVGIGHGQMSESELEEAMINFYQGKTNVLVCTTIIESGLDVPNANTLIVHRADTFGLSQLYQIRGRVGRGQNRAFAYFLIPGETLISTDAQKRLEVLQRFVDLGSGFKIASHDLEIRGGGNLLGPEQSGHIASVGFELYTQLLDEAIQDLNKISTPVGQFEPEIKCTFPAFLPEIYIPDNHQRLQQYRRLSATRTEEDLVLMEEEFIDRYGPVPSETRNLFALLTIKHVLIRYGIELLTIGPGKMSFLAGHISTLDPIKVIAKASAQNSGLQMTPDPKGTKITVQITAKTLPETYNYLEILLKSLSG